MTIQQRIIFFFSLIIALLVTLVLLMWYRLSLQQQLTQAQENRYESYRLAVHLKSVSDQLTRMARTYTLTADPRYKEYYQHILAIRNGEEPRPSDYDILFWDRMTHEREYNISSSGQTISLLHLVENSDIPPEEIRTLKEAKKYSDKLTEMERNAFHLMELASINDSLSNVNRLTAQQLLHGARYHRLKAEMMQRISYFFSQIDHRTSSKISRITRLSGQVDLLLILLMLLLIFVALFSWFHSRKNIVHPLRELIHWTEKLKEGQFNLDGRIRGQDEISQLARSFTSMADTLHKSLNDLDTKAHTDGLTGLPNRLLLEIDLERFHRDAQYYGTRCNILLLDIDHFKSINDRYGHDIGDRVLVHFARLLKKEILPPHSVGRWGGEEFLIITRELSLFETQLLAESFRKEVQKSDFPENIDVTVSIGLTMLDANQSITESLIRADKALYRAKSAGRNRVELGARSTP